MKGGVPQPRHAPDREQPYPELQRGEGEEPQHAGQSRERAHAQSEYRQRANRADPIDEPTGGDHPERVDDQERRVDQSHVSFADTVADEHLGTRDRDGHPVEMGQPGESHQ
jgi:hypothetical protein